MKTKHLKDLALAINYHLLEHTGTEFEESLDFENTNNSKYVYDYIHKEREKIAKRISEENKELITISNVSSMIKYLQSKRVN